MTNTNVAECSSSASCNCYYSSGDRAQPITNAIELNFGIPFTVPDDRTEAIITCADNDAANTNHVTVF